MSEATNETSQENGAENGAGGAAEKTQTATFADRFVFPHETPTEHWQADFGDSKQVYEGTALPIWLLAGWAIFILWAVVYLLFGLPTAF